MSNVRSEKLNARYASHPKSFEHHGQIADLNGSVNMTVQTEKEPFEFKLLEFKLLNGI